MKNGFLVVNQNFFFSIKMPFALYSVVTFRIMMEMFSFFFYVKHSANDCVIKIPADVIFRAALAFFVFEHFRICTWSVVEYLNNDNGNQRIYYLRLYV